MSSKKLLLFLAMATAFCAVAEAKQVTLTAQDKSLKVALVRAGCAHPDRQLVIQTMRRSGIFPSEVDRLPVGTTITIPDDCGTSLAPSKVDARAWKTLVEEHSMKQRFRDLENQIAKLTIDNQVLRSLLESANRTIASLTQKPNKESNTMSTAAQPSLIWWQVGCVLLSCTCLLLIVRNVRLKKLAKSRQIGVHPLVELPPKPQPAVIMCPPVGLSIWFHSRLVDFYDDSVYWIGCPFCYTRLKPDRAEAEKHLMKEHADLRIKQIRPEEAEQLLGIFEPEPELEPEPVALLS